MFYRISKPIQNKIKKVISGLLIAGVVFAFGVKPSTLAQTTSDLQQQKADKQKQLQEIENRINGYQSQIKESQKFANTLANQIKTINLEIASTEAEIEATNNKIDATNLSIADVSNQIVTTLADIAKQKGILKTLIAEITDLDQRSPLEIALANDNFQEFLDQVQYTSSIQARSQETLTKIKQLEADLEARQADLKAEKANLDDLKHQLDITNAGLAAQQNTKQQILAQTRGQERAYQKLLTVSQQEEDNLQKEINDLDSQISARLGDTKLKPVHGLIAWPMQGTITQGYGNTGFTSMGYSFHNGIDIAAPPGTPIYSAGNGTVVGTGTGNGAYGNWVAIKHDTGRFAGRAIISLYGHMSSFRLHTGQTVKEGDLVGFEGNTGNTTRLIYGPHRGYHLHFTVFDARGFGVQPGAYPKIYGPYDVPYGATYSPLDFL
jgi:murein DD-endopeptidase MepM/ murein hydrolase activator NlpD